MAWLECQGQRRKAPGSRARQVLAFVFSGRRSLLFFTASGEMGKGSLGLRPALPGSLRGLARVQLPGYKAACQAFLENSVDLILFCGGDGTARDVASSAGHLPILGIPAGVKMHSGVFAISPQAAAELALGFVRGELKARETEIVDVDEELYRAGELQTRLYAIARTPYKPVLVQERKRIYVSCSEEEFKDQIALFASSS